MSDQQKSADYFFPQQVAQAAQAVPLAPRPLMAPIPPELFAPGPDGLYTGLEDAVDGFIGSSKLAPGQGFILPHPDGPRQYEYLGPGSGGRKNWREIKQRMPAQTS